MSLAQKIPIVRLQGIPEDECYWAVVAVERDDMDQPFSHQEIETDAYDDLNSAKRIAIIIRSRNSDFTRNVKIVQKVIDDQFC
jgi:hypothetical protein